MILPLLQLLQLGKGKQITGGYFFFFYFYLFALAGNGKYEIFLIFPSPYSFGC